MQGLSDILCQWRAENGALGIKVLESCFSPKRDAKKELGAENPTAPYTTLTLIHTKGELSLGSPFPQAKGKGS